jgi:hypothetical protein
MPCARRSRYNSLRCAHLFLSEVTDVSFVPRKLIAHRHFVQRTPTRSMRQVRLSISHPAQCEHRGWLVKYPDNTQDPQKRRMDGAGLCKRLLAQLRPRSLTKRDTYLGSPEAEIQSGWACARSQMDSIMSSVSFASRAKIPCWVNCSVFFNSAGDFPALRPCLT